MIKLLIGLDAIGYAIWRFLMTIAGIASLLYFPQSVICNIAENTNLDVTFSRSGSFGNNEEIIVGTTENLFALNRQ